MGLDQWLMAKKDGINNGLKTGVCGGLFGVAPVMDGVELGYWRKDYFIDGVIADQVGSCENCSEVYFDEDDVSAILEVLRAELDNALSREAELVAQGEDLEDYWWEKDTSEYIKYDIETFEKALEYLADGYQVYYHIWF